MAVPASFALEISLMEFQACRSRSGNSYVLVWWQVVEVSHRNFGGTCSVWIQRVSWASEISHLVGWWSGCEHLDNGYHTYPQADALCHDRLIRSVHVWRSGPQANHVALSPPAIRHQLLTEGIWGHCIHGLHGPLIGRPADGTFHTSKAKVYPAGLNTVIGTEMFNFAMHFLDCCADPVLPEVLLPYLEQSFMDHNTIQPDYHGGGIM